jgi:hypothetical protein
MIPNMNSAFLVKYYSSRSSGRTLSICDPIQSCDFVWICPTAACMINTAAGSGPWSLSLSLVSIFYMAGRLLVVPSLAIVVRKSGLSTTSKRYSHVGGERNQSLGKLTTSPQRPDRQLAPYKRLSHIRLYSAPAARV